MKLPPLKEVDPSLPERTTTLNFNACHHDLYVVSGSECRCKRCGAGWTGPHIVDLVKASKRSS